MVPVLSNEEARFQLQLSVTGVTSKELEWLRIKDLLCEKKTVV